MISYRARFVFPVAQPPIADGVVTIEGEQIAAVEPFSGQSNAVDLGNVAIVPGLVNAHTHLEFGGLERPLGEAGMPFPDWIREVLRFRESSANSATDADAGDAIHSGLYESARSGVATIGDIVLQLPTSAIEPPLERVAFVELRAPRASDVPAAMKLARAASNEHGVGLSPHAPYTVHHELLTSAVELSKRRQCPLAMHLAESREELQYLRDGTGPFRELLAERGAWEAGAVPANSTPFDYLQRLARADRALVIHGNYLDDREIDFLAARADRMAVVYCARTHAYFKHAPYPLATMLDRGVSLALGTDSRASNPDLNLFEEIRFVARQHGISPRTALQLGTFNGACALGIAQQAGSLASGKLANLAIFALPFQAAPDPHELLFDSGSFVVATLCRGRLAYGHSEMWED
jgi:cytosine/adenosine deaminase-related metal-dependent hydrolase